MAVFVWRNAFGRTRKRNPRLLLDRFRLKDLRGEVRDLGWAIVDGPVDRPHLGQAAQRLDKAVGAAQLTRRRDQDDERLTGVPPLPEDEVTEKALRGHLAVGSQTPLTVPSRAQRP